MVKQWQQLTLDSSLVMYICVTEIVMNYKSLCVKCDNEYVANHARKNVKSACQLLQGKCTENTWQVLFMIKNRNFKLSQGILGDPGIKLYSVLTILTQIWTVIKVIIDFMFLFYCYFCFTDKQQISSYLHSLKWHIFELLYLSIDL